MAVLGKRRKDLVQAVTLPLLVVVVAAGFASSSFAAAPFSFSFLAASAAAAVTGARSTIRESMFVSPAALIVVP